MNGVNNSKHLQELVWWEKCTDLASARGFHAGQPCLATLGSEGPTNQWTVEEIRRPEDLAKLLRVEVETTKCFGYFPVMSLYCCLGKMSESDLLLGVSLCHKLDEIDSDVSMELYGRPR